MERGLSCSLLSCGLDIKEIRAAADGFATSSDNSKIVREMLKKKFGDKLIQCDEILIDENVLALNTELAAYSKIGYTEIRREQFEKTPKQSIRRFMYK